MGWKARAPFFWKIGTPLGLLGFLLASVFLTWLRYQTPPVDQPPPPPATPSLRCVEDADCPVGLRCLDATHRLGKACKK